MLWQRPRIVVNDQEMWTAIAESKNERLHCRVPQPISKDGPRPETESHAQAEAADAEDARFVVSALGVWESQHDPSQLYFVRSLGLDVVRQQKPSSGAKAVV